MRWIVILIVVGLAIFFFIGQNQEAPKPAATPAPQTATVTPEVTPAPPAPVQSAPPAAQPAVDPNLVQRMRQVAQQTGVQLTGFQPQQPGSAWIGIAWAGGNKALGGDYLEALQRQGLIRDFDVDNAKYGMMMQNGSPLNTAQFLVRF